MLPATSLEETWVVYGAAANVCDTSLGVKSNCAEDRGGVFDSAKSPTWTQTQEKAESNQFILGLNEQFGYQGVGQYGLYTPTEDLLALLKPSRLRYSWARI